MNLEEFDFLKELYLKRGFSLYIIGGTSRDMLLKRPFTDFDFVTDATPEQEKSFLTEADFTFARFGSIRVPFREKKIDITTLRKESNYSDSRHPNFIEFVKDPSLDYKRRDFTINALYIDKDYKILDYCGGMQDLENKIIRFIGAAKERIEEDPLRICRAERFRDMLGFSFAEETAKAIAKQRHLLDKIKPEKLKEEERKGWRR